MTNDDSDATTTTTSIRSTETKITFRVDRWMGAKDGWRGVRNHEVRDASNPASVTTGEREIKAARVDFEVQLRREGSAKQRLRVVKVVEVSGISEEVIG